MIRGAREVPLAPFPRPGPWDATTQRSRIPHIEYATGAGAASPDTPCHTPPMDRAAIRELERFLDRAWPARIVASGEGWAARFSDGMHRRLNSASVCETADPADTVARLERWYERHDAPPIFKLTAAAAPGFDAYLDHREYRIDARVSVMTGGLEPGSIPAPAGGARIEPSPTGAWLETFATISGYGPERRRLLGDLLERIGSDAAYASVERDRETIAVGMSVLLGDRLAIFEMATHPARRRQGHARSVLARLLTDGRGRGARTACLQVLVGNEPAERFYRAAGFEPHHDYWYRVAPEGLSTGPR